MITHDDMVDAFGGDGLLLMDPEQARERGFSDADAEILCQVGLPVRADQVFTTFLADEPRTGSPVVFKTSSGDVDVFILGGTSGDAGMRYFLDISSGVVGLLSLDGEAQAEKVNSSLANFVEFLHRIRLRQQALNESPDSGQEHTEKLWLSLKELDPVAFGHAEAWWSMVMDHLMGRDLIAETRAFLQQRRAEVAEAASESHAPAAGSGSHRDRFDRALRRLEAESWQVVDSEHFAADTESEGLLSPSAELDDHFDSDGSLVKDVNIAWRGGLTSRIQSVFAREGLVVSVPEQGEDEDDDLLELDADELRKRSDAAMEALFDSVHGLNKPKDGVVTCLATDRSSDLCRIVRAFDRLAEHGYFAEPDLWPTPSGAWQQVHAQTEEGESPKAVFWITQRHTVCFDARGDLVDELPLQWAGDRDVIAEALAETGLVVTVPEDDGSTFVLAPAS
ncbi:SUKH-4 family immunity protein [Saccharopolyspora sp. NPDC050389]|uniref:SUKH-4 family immunity protein n=1 Tax=Saccharopolyspora sp. NPDC050389 TaxID=3155516 RepID=UPI003411F0EC